MVLKQLAACLFVVHSVTGCSANLATRMDNGADGRNPMFGADYAADADVPLVMRPSTALSNRPRQANFDAESASRRTRDMADWVVSARDNLNLPFAIVDKINAKVYVFEADGRLHGAAPVLLGQGHGDDSAPGVGNMPMSQIPPADRTTPAGRFVSAMGRNSHGKEILWLDYENAISLHPVITTRPEQRRAERLATPTPLDNRISYGCINVPVDFFKDVIHSKFSGQTGIVYVLPEARP